MIRRRLVVPGVIVATLAAAGIVIFGTGRFLWNRATGRAVAELQHRVERASATDAPILATPPASLPAPVARYFAVVLGEHRAPVRAARVEWSGEFRNTPDGRWAPFSAVQYFTTDPPGFVWDARIALMPIVPVHVRDSYRNGVGAVHARIGGIVPVADEGGTHEVAQSALARWLGEAAWFPTALLPGPALEWEAVDDTTARSTTRDAGIEVTATFHFAADGTLSRMTTHRYRTIDGVAVLTPFEGRYGDYVRRGGVLVPGSAEVAWLLPEGRFPYWRGRADVIEYDTAAVD
jgi:hypothetical protein